MKPQAVVFDNSGTLIRRDRVLKHIKTGEICDHLNSMDVIDYTPDLALVVLQTDPGKCLLNAQSRQTIYEFITRNKVSFDISYTYQDYTKKEVLKALENDNSTLKDIQDTIQAVVDKDYDVEICSGSGFIIDMARGQVEFTISSGGRIFPEVRSVVEYLKKKEVSIFIASGDRKGSLKQLASYLSIPPENVFPTADTRRKKEIVAELKKKYQVMMVGNGSNDILALKEADLGVLTTQQKEDLPQKVYDAADVIIENIEEIKNLDF
ncbi:HAD family hydrolase [Methanobacterium movens]